MDILSNLLVSRRGRFLGGQNCSAWRAKNSAGRVYNDEDEDEDEDGVEVFTVSSRQCSRTGADLSPPPPPPPPSIPRYLVEPYRHAAAKMRGRACLPVAV